MCLAIALGNCGELRLATGDVAAAAELIGDSLRMCDQLGMVYAGSYSLDSAATLLASVGEHAAAVRVEAAAQAAMQRIQASWWQPRVARRDESARRGTATAGRRRRTPRPGTTAARPDLPRRRRRRDGGTPSSRRREPANPD